MCLIFRKSRQKRFFHPLNKHLATLYWLSKYEVMKTVQLDTS
jgi:hypothetical protein